MSASMSAYRSKKTIECPLSPPSTFPSLFNFYLVVDQTTSLFTTIHTRHNNDDVHNVRNTMSDLSLLTALLPSDPSLLPLLRSRSTFSHPSRLSSSEVHKFLNKLGSFVCVPVLPGQGKSSNSNNTSNLNHHSNSSSEEWTTRRDAWSVAQVILEMDQEGYTLGGGWGKTWLLNLLGSLNVSPESS